MAGSNWPVQATAGANGVATAALPSLAIGKRWTVDMISVQSNSVLASDAFVYLNNLFVIGTTQGNQDTASGVPPLQVGSKDALVVQWTGCTPGAQCSAVFFYDDSDT